MSTLYPALSLAGDVVLISGATSGIGEACAHRFAEAGCKLVVTGRRAERLDALKAALEAKYGVDVKCVTMDVTDLDRVAGLPAELLPLEVDILINNAGLALGVAGADSNSISDIQQMMATNVTALMAMTAAFLPGMKARGKGHLINIGSIAGHESYAGGSVYCASKHAVTAFTAAARHDLVGTPVSWWKVPSDPVEDGTPPASPDHLEARGAPTHPGAPPQQLGGVPWPQQPASGRPKVEGFSAVPSPPGVELVLLLFAWQQCLPHAVFLNRGNHEDSAVNCTCVQSS